MQAKDDLVRGKVATYIGAQLNEVALVPSTTIALNSVAAGLISSGYLKGQCLKYLPRFYSRTLVHIYIYHIYHIQC